MVSTADGDGRAPKAAEVVANRFRSRIATGELPVGTDLPPEAQLTDELGVSRPTLRAAFRILETEGLVTMRRGSRGGATVMAPTVDAMTQRAISYLQYRGTTLAEMHEVRLLLELPCVRQLARTADGETIAAMRDLIAQGQAVLDDREKVREVGGLFHRFIIEFTGNPMLILTAKMADDIIRRQTAEYQSRSLSSRRRGKYFHDHHVELVELVEAGDEEGAVALWTEHDRAIAEMLSRAGGADTLLDLVE